MLQSMGSIELDMTERLNWTAIGKGRNIREYKVIVKAGGAERKLGVQENVYLWLHLCFHINLYQHQIRSDQSLSRVRLFATP